MKLFSKVFVFLCFISLFTSLTTNAQRGKIHLPSSTTTSKGVQPDSQVLIASYEVYLLGIGSTANSTGMSMISCDNDDGGVTVGSDDGDLTCYAVAGSDGSFDITGLYYGFTDGTGCTTGAAQTIYIEIRKGTVGSVSNPALALMAIPPSTWTCDYIYTNQSSVFFDVSDFSNTMAAFGLAPFGNWNNATTSDGISAGVSSGKAALLLAFDAINSIIPVSSSHYSGSDSNVQKQLNTIADVISACEASNGTGTGCTDLFSYTTNSNLGFTGSHSPVDTWQAAASMGQDPSNNVTNEFNLIVATPPWSPTDTSAPSSWSVPVSGAPTISSVSSHTAVKGSTHTITITGTNLTETGTGACPVVAVAYQESPSVTSCSSTSITVAMPSAAAKSAIAVYVNGMVSNAVYFTITNI